MSLTLPLDLEALHHDVTGWFAAEGRDLPWRRPECSPWGVMVSEFMLQQTPVVRVLPVWEQWMERWPEPAALASEPSGEAVRAWGRLGYPRRALRLAEAARRITEEHGGRVPSTYADLLALPGVGSYTAAAISCFAFGIPETVVDTNIRRVHARLVGGRALPEPSYTAAEARLAAELMPSAGHDGAELGCAWNAAVMELGALVCTARSPRCGECPVAGACAWVAAGRPEPHYTPKGQAWAGTDRQLRGAMMAVLRASDAPVEAALLVEVASVDPVPAHVGAQSDPATEAEAALRRLRALPAADAQRRRCLQGLISDGLASETSHGVTLPH
ncbi:A/G-specific adenine glycosylase [Arthrobacter sp. JSM 101049]|uniref:A/G-specific adenine glycosylase n=1 Tax=Arthrobacter sp. JSM 101049 TaxID=929097 RepID=UPI003566E0BE